jgi:hypothetical protein
MLADFSGVIQERDPLLYRYDPSQKRRLVLGESRSPGRILPCEDVAPSPMDLLERFRIELHPAPCSGDLAVLRPGSCAQMAGTGWGSSAVTTLRARATNRTTPFHEAQNLQPSSISREETFRSCLGLVMLIANHNSERFAAELKSRSSASAWLSPAGPESPRRRM